MAELASNAQSPVGDLKLVWTLPDDLLSNPKYTPVFPLIWKAQIRSLQLLIKELYPELPVDWNK